MEGIGISLPGRVEPGSGRLVFAPNLKWTDFDIAEAVHKATGLDVEMENAVNACVLAAVWFDHVESRNLVVVTVSEGIGAGVLVNGRLTLGFSGMAGEFSHVPLDPDGGVRFESGGLALLFRIQLTEGLKVSGPVEPGRSGRWARREGPGDDGAFSWPRDANDRRWLGPGANLDHLETSPDRGTDSDG